MYNGLTIMYAPAKGRKSVPKNRRVASTSLEEVVVPSEIIAFSFVQKGQRVGPAYIIGSRCSFEDIKDSSMSEDEKVDAIRAMERGAIYYTCGEDSIYAIESGEALVELDEHRRPHLVETALAAA